MKRIYENKGFLRRQMISLAVLVIVLIYGVFELYTAFSSSAGDQTAAMFGVLFIGGSLYGFYSIIGDSRDIVGSIDEDGDRLVATLWRPLGLHRVSGPASEFRNWRHYVKVTGRNVRNHLIMVDNPGHAHPLTLEFPRGVVLTPELKALAPEATAEIERVLAPATT